MNPFVHGHLAKVGPLLETSNALSRELLTVGHLSSDRLAEHLDRCARTYADLGLSEHESRLLALGMDLQAVRRGGGSRTQAVADGAVPRRRELERAAIHSALQSSAELLRNDIQQQKQRLLRAGEMLEGILLAALQKKWVSPAAGRRPHDANFAEVLWSRLLKAEELTLVCQRVLMTTNRYDVLLLVQDILTRIQPGPGPEP